MCKLDENKVNIEKIVGKKNIKILSKVSMY